MINYYCNFNSRFYLMVNSLYPLQGNTDVASHDNNININSFNVHPQQYLNYPIHKQSVLDYTYNYDNQKLLINEKPITFRVKNSLGGEISTNSTSTLPIVKSEVTDVQQIPEIHLNTTTQEPQSYSPYIGYYYNSPTSPISTNQSPISSIINSYRSFDEQAPTFTVQSTQTGSATQSSVTDHFIVPSVLDDLDIDL